jgi:hypothetical protein
MKEVRSVRAVADEGVGAPERGMRVRVQLDTVLRIAWSIHDGEHGLLQSLRTTELRIGRLPPKHFRDEIAGR